MIEIINSRDKDGVDDNYLYMVKSPKKDKVTTNLLIPSLNSSDEDESTINPKFSANDFIFEVRLKDFIYKDKNVKMLHLRDQSILLKCRNANN